MPFWFQGSKSYDVAVDPHMLETYHSQIEDIDIQGNPSLQRLLDDFSDRLDMKQIYVV